MNNIKQTWLACLVMALTASACTDPEPEETQDCTSTVSVCKDDTNRTYCKDGKEQTEACEFGCEDGECLECMDGAIKCLNANQVGYCHAGHYLPFACEFGCSDGECNPDPDEEGMDVLDWGARDDLDWEPDVMPDCDGEYGACLFNGANCPSSYITVNSTSDKKKCVMQSKLSEEEIAAFDTNDKDHLLCIKGMIPNRYCRKVSPEALGEDSEFPIVEGQICTAEQLNPPENSLRIHMIDVGNGDSIWIQTPDQKNILIDGGEAFGMALSAGPAVVDYLDFHGFKKGSEFDGVILSHPHSDHFGGFNTIFKKGYYKLRNYIDPMAINSLEIDTKTYNDWLGKVTDQVADENIYMPAGSFFEPGDKLPEDMFGTSVEAQYLFSRSKLAKSCEVKGVKCEKKDVNSSSLFFKLSYAGRSFVFAGDAGTLDEKAAMEAADEYLDINFLKVCHHGSNTSSSEAYLNRIWKNVPYEERGAFISSGRRMFGATRTMRPEIVERIAEFVPPAMFMSTNAGDDNKESDKDAFRDDNILIVVKENGEYYSCYEGIN